MTESSPKPHILVVEDEPRIAGFISRGFEVAGMEVVVAEDGEVGAFMAVNEPFDAVVLDLSLPGLSGMEVLQLVRTSKPTLPVVVLTARDEPDDRHAALGAGATDYVTKPFSFEELRAIVLGRVGFG